MIFAGHFAFNFIVVRKSIVNSEVTSHILINFLPVFLEVSLFDDLFLSRLNRNLDKKVDLNYLSLNKID